MGRTFNLHAGRLRSTEFDSRGALIFVITHPGPPRRGPLAAVGELESPSRCQREDRGFESRRWRSSRGARGVLREALNLARRVRTSPPLIQA
jgi:hypothetical protein